MLVGVGVGVLLGGGVTDCVITGVGVGVFVGVGVGVLVGVGVGVLLGVGVTGCVITGVGEAVGVKFTIPLSPPNVCNSPDSSPLFFNASYVERFHVNVYLLVESKIYPAGALYSLQYNTYESTDDSISFISPLHLRYHLLYQILPHQLQVLFLHQSCHQ